MKAVILAGGLGTRLSEETSLKPKPMVEIGGRPMLWHIMKTYAEHGITDFVICLGYRGYLIKEYFANHVLHTSDVTIDLRNNSIDYHGNAAEPWRVTLIDTGPETMTGGRLRRVRDQLDGTFCLTYGDGVGDVDIRASIEFHRSHGKLATLTATQPPGRFGLLALDSGGVVRSFEEKPTAGGWINGGFFVLEPGVVDYIAGDSTVWEREPLTRLATDQQLVAYRHSGFWACMDTVRDRQFLETLWTEGKAPWKTWA